MEKYLKPTVVINEDLSEGVYAASGSSSDCWTVNVVSAQDWNGSDHVFEVRCSHKAGSDNSHSASAITVTISFNNTLTAASSETGNCKYSGNTLTAVRNGHANANDSVTFKVFARANDEATTKGLAVTGSTITCTES